MTTTSTRKRKTKRSAGWQKAQAEHDAWLRKMGVHPDQLKHKEKSIGQNIPDYSENRSAIPTSDRVGPIEGKRKAQEYSGDYIVGLATMHKSNIVPVGRGNNAEDFAKMRR
jgi:hypothetical protein